MIMLIANVVIISFFTFKYLSSADNIEKEYIAISYKYANKGEDFIRYYLYSCLNNPAETSNGLEFAKKYAELKSNEAIVFLLLVFSEGLLGVDTKNLDMKKIFIAEKYADYDCSSSGYAVDSIHEIIGIGHANDPEYCKDISPHSEFNITYPRKGELSHDNAKRHHCNHTEHLCR